MKYIIKEMTEMEKPREKLFYLGSAALTDYELLAILLRTGTKDKSVIDVAIDLLKELNTINDLYNITMEELLKHKGIGKVKAIELLATIELSKRINNYSSNVIYIKTSKDCFNYLKNKLSNLDQEHFVAVYLNVNNQVITNKIISIGTMTATIANPKDVIKWGLKLSAYGIIVSHNHPSGNVVPSQEDLKFTADLIKACKAVDLLFVDHIIIGKNNYFSFQQKSIFTD